MDFSKLDQIDKSFDNFTGVLFVSTLTGAGRAVYGVAELITGVVKGIIFGIGQLFISSFEKEFDKACVHMFFGAANIVKAIFESIPVFNFLAESFTPIYRRDWTAFHRHT